MTNRMIHTPDGVRDVYGPELKYKMEVKDVLHSVIHSYGYKDIETPTLEYFEVFNNELGTTPGKDMYRLFDSEGLTMALRPDFTPSIARCAAKYFYDENTPVRLCYEGKAFANKSELQGKLKESTQMGVELIDNVSSVDDDAEMIILAAKSLEAIGFKEFQIAIGDISYFKSICNSINLSGDDFELLKEYMALRNYFGARELLERNNVNADVINSLVEVSDITSVEELSNLLDKTSIPEARAAISRLIDIYHIIKLQNLDKYITFDLGMINQYHYYSGVLFRAYTYGVGGSIIKGGRYDDLIGKFGKDSSAVGMVFLVDDIMTALRMQNITSKVELMDLYVIYTPNNRAKAFELMNKKRAEGVCVSGMLYNDKLSKDEYINAAKGKANTTFIID